MQDAPCEHRIVILLSDAKPNDIVKMQQGQRCVEYACLLYTSRCV